MIKIAKNVHLYMCLKKVIAMENLEHSIHLSAPIIDWYNTLQVPFPLLWLGGAGGGVLPQSTRK